MDTKSPVLPANIRVLIGMVASPFLFAFFYIGYCLYIGEPGQISYAVVLFAAVGSAIYYVVFTGRMPFRRKKGARHSAAPVE